MNIIDEPKKSASLNYGSFIQQDQKAICQHDETFSVNMICKAQNYPAIQPSLPFFKVETHLTHILTVHLYNRMATLRSYVVKMYAKVIWIHFVTF